MKALITGASSGIGRDMARYLSSIGYDLIIVSRDEDKLNELKDDLNTNVEVIPMDLTVEANCENLYKKVKDKNIDVLINNAGFGLAGVFNKTDFKKEMSMIDLNIKAYHILTKLFVTDFIKRNSGYILNVASSAAFQPGPLMTTYYATKSYVYSMTLALYEELRHKKSNVHISCLCPGPVNTNFNNVANCEFKVKALSSEFVAKYAIDKMFKNKLLIIPGFTMKLGYIFGKIVPSKLKLKIIYNIQYRKVSGRK
ncbi:MAG: SDR family oxidoreductase [bacterium]|nr:SDR family oxidoreductase [bacterium]